VGLWSWRGGEARSCGRYGEAGNGQGGDPLLRLEGYERWTGYAMGSPFAPGLLDSSLFHSKEDA